MVKLLILNVSWMSILETIQTIALWVVIISVLVIFLIACYIGGKVMEYGIDGSKGRKWIPGLVPETAHVEEDDKEDNSLNDEVRRQELEKLNEDIRSQALEKLKEDVRRQVLEELKEGKN